MLLSYDRVLQLLAEGKSILKIAEMAKCEGADVVNIIKEVRGLLSKHEKPLSKKKIIIKKKSNDSYDDESTININEDDNLKKIFTGSELTAIPVESTLLMYIAGISKGNPGPSGIGIVIFDGANVQVGKISSYIGKYNGFYPIYFAILRAMKIAGYFQTKNLKIRTDNDIVIRQINTKSKLDNYNDDKIFKEINVFKKTFPSCVFENVSKNLNEKAVYLANKSMD